MRYDEIREYVRAHFQGLLARAKDTIGETGQFGEDRIDAFKTAERLAGSDFGDWAGLVGAEITDGLVGDFCERYGLPVGDLTPDSRAWLLDELRKTAPTTPANATMPSLTAAPTQSFRHARTPSS